MTGTPAADAPPRPAPAVSGDSLPRRIACLVLAVVALAPVCLSAQLTTLRFRTWGLDEGMSHDAAFTVYQDRSGIIWVGTQDGLLRFDGERFESFRHDLDDTLSLSDDHVMAIHDDGNGGLWIGTWNGWLNRLDLATGRTERIPRPTGLSATTPGGGEVIDDIVDLEDGTLGLATDFGALAYDPTSGAYRSIDPEAGAGMDGLGATAIMHGDDGRLLIGYFDGRLRSAARPAAGGSPAVSTLAQLEGAVSAIRAAPEGRVWVGTRDGGAYGVDADGGEIVERFHADGDTEHRLPGNRVQDVWVDQTGDLWIATLSGLAMVPVLGGPVQHFVEDDADPFSLPANLVLKLFEDRQGVMWVGTFSGLGRFHLNDKAFTRFQSRSSAGDGIAGSGVLAIAERDENHLWLGTFGGGLDLLDLRDGSVAHYPPGGNADSAPSHGEIQSLARSSEGGLWIATIGGGIDYLDPTSRRFSRIPIELSEGRSGTPPVWTILVDRDGTVWAGTQTDGLHRFDPVDGTFRRYRGPGQTWDFGSDFVWPIIEDRAGNLWVGASEGGITRIDPERRTATLYSTENSGLHSDLILTLFEGPDGSIWFGTEGAGLGRLDPAAGTFTTYTTRDGLPHNNVEAIRADAAGDIWVSTVDGLARVDPAGEITNFSLSSGLHGRRFYANAAFATSDGRLVFGGEGGLTVVDPARLVRVETPSEVVLTDFTVSGEFRPVTSSDMVEGIDLGPEENFFAFRFTATDYADPERVLYRYRLDPLDADWVDNGNAKLANYTSVPPDGYVFRVSVRNSFGVWNDDALAIPLVVHPPYYSTWWFRSMVLVGIVSLLAVAYVVRMRQVTRLHELRFGIAGKLHDEIGANLAAIALKSAAVLDSADLGDSDRERLAAMGRIARETTHAIRETVWVVSTKYDSFSGLLTKMRDTADTLLGRSVECSYSVSPVPPNQPLDMELRQGIFLFYKEVLQNVIKHADATHVSIDIRYTKPFLTVIVEDDGRGFDLDTVVEGHGLANMRRRAERLGAVLAIETATERGTRVELRVRIR